MVNCLHELQPVSSLSSDDVNADVLLCRNCAATTAFMASGAPSVAMTPTTTEAFARIIKDEKLPVSVDQSTVPLTLESDFTRQHISNAVSSSSAAAVPLLEMVCKSRTDPESLFLPVVADVRSVRWEQTDNCVVPEPSAAATSDIVKSECNATSKPLAVDLHCFPSSGCSLVSLRPLVSFAGSVSSQAGADPRVTVKQEVSPAVNCSVSSAKDAPGAMRLSNSAQASAGNSAEVAVNKSVKFNETAVCGVTPVYMNRCDHTGLDKLSNADVKSSGVSSCEKTSVSFRNDWKCSGARDAASQKCNRPSLDAVQHCGNERKSTSVSSKKRKVDTTAKAGLY